MSRKIFHPRPEQANISLASSPPHHRRRRSGVVPLGLGFYKGECQGKYFTPDRSRQTFPWLPAPLTIEDAGLVLCPSDLGSIKGNVKENISPPTGAGKHFLGFQPPSP